MSPTPGDCGSGLPPASSLRLSCSLVGTGSHFSLHSGPHFGSSLAPSSDLSVQPGCIVPPGACSEPSPAPRFCSRIL